RTYVYLSLRCAELQPSIFGPTISSLCVCVGSLFLLASEAVGVGQLGKRIGSSANHLLQRSYSVVEFSCIAIERSYRSQDIGIVRCSALSFIQILFGSLGLIQFLIRSRNQEVGS